jgi:hypothetical protein
MDAKEFIKKRLKEFDSSIDTSPGSPIGDLLINPLSSIIQPSLDFEDYMVSNLSLKDPESMSEEELDAIAANFLVERTQGQKASGHVRLFYSTPITLTIPKGTLFRNDQNLTYRTTSSYSITRQMMTLNNEYYPLYHTGDIPIEATDYGEEYITRADTITELVSTFSPAPVAIRNLTAVTSGADRESNSELKTKILNSVNNQSVASADGIKRVLNDNFSTIDSLTVISNGDAEMIRDVTYSGSVLGNFYTSDFNFKVSGLYNYPHNESIAYVGRFADTDSSTAIALPDPEDFIYEFTNEMYAGIYKNDDPSYAELTVYNILEENFAETETSTGYNLN